MRGGPDDDRWSRLAALYRQEQPGLVRFAALLIGSTAVAEELVQDAFVRLHPRLDDVREPGAYLQTTVVNLCRGHQRRITTADRLRPTAPPPVPDLDVPADRTEVWLALQRLPERRRIALVCRFYLDLSDDAIAEALAVRPATVRSLVHRGLQQLQEVLTP